MDFKKLNTFGGWLSFAIAMTVYALTIEPTTSFWDCGEYIATSYRLEIGHPPGAPTFMMLGRIFTLFADPEYVAARVNLLSALSSALTILFMFWTISYLAKKMIGDADPKGGNLIAIFGSAFVGAMAFTFSDTFWFSAVEGEVYAMSSLCTAIVFWAIFKWEEVADEPHSDRWLIFIWFIIGLSIGVHLLNLLAIPSMVLVYYFKKFKPNRKGLIISLVIGVFLLGFVQMVLVPQIVNIAAKFELLFTNSFGLPFNTGSFIFGLVVMGLVFYGIKYSEKKNNPTLNTAVLSFFVLLIGYTSFGMIIIRSNANPPIDENNPENLVNLLSYLKREQYGDIPLVKGQYWDTPLDKTRPYKDGDPVYYPDYTTGKYEIADDKKNSVYNYAKELETFFPRMWSTKPQHINAYKAWSNFKGTPVNYIDRQNGGMKTFRKPTFGENLRFFTTYQAWWMYGRYFMWNFAGRQNDIQGHGIVDPDRYTHGNWISGITALDEARLGKLDQYPSELENNKAYNKLYLLPLILGLIGLFFQSKFDKNNAFVVGLLFLMTGLAIVVYLNNSPFQPRERDYAFVGSFYAFALWIGLGVAGIYKALQEKLANKNVLAIGTTAVTFLLVPVLMANQNWDDHDRSERYTAREMARNYLDSCEENAILFTNGDNDTFPLWYLQEVEGYRTDVRVVNLMLLNTDWYVDMMKRASYKSAALPITLEKSQYRQGTRDMVFVSENPRIDQEKYYPIKDIFDFITDDSKRRDYGNGNKFNYVPTRKMMIPVDSAKVVANGTVPAELANQIVSEVKFTKKGGIVQKNELIVWDLLSHFNWDRPIYFSLTMGSDAFYGLEDYFSQEGFAYRFIPVKTKSDRRQRRFGRVNTDIMYDKLVNQFNWGGFENPELYLDETNRRFIINIRLTYSRLAEALIAEGKKKEAEDVLDQAVYISVNDNFKNDGSLISLAEGYYKVGNIEKANALVDKVLNRESEYFYYFMNQDDAIRIESSMNIQRSVNTVGQLTLLTSQQYPESGKGQELMDIYNEMSQLLR